MTLEALYRRSLVVVALLALSLAALMGYFAAAWGLGIPIVGVLVASLGLATAAAVARRGRLWRSVVLLAIGSGLCASAAMGAVPWWAAIPAGLGVGAFALLLPAMFRRDRLAALVVTVLGAAFGVQGAWTFDAAIQPPAATLDGFEVAAPEIPVAGSDAYLRGRADAERDLAAGRWRLLTYGYPAASRSLYREALLRDGIELEAVAGCVVTKELMEHVRGYNEVMEAAIARLLGPGYLAARRQAAQDATQPGVY
ncbi:MAG TPA: hypothetical protein ENK57_17400 [Polyangiaceae bacterium]|nr:hypothetical protein [Polyangiaceae bacterium]